MLQCKHWRSCKISGEGDPGDEHPAMVTLRTEAPQHGITTGVETPDGERRWLSINSYPVRRPSDGAGDQVVAVLRIVEMSAATMEKSARRVAE
jgi:hypothetical protein